MAIGLIGKKQGMSRLFTDDGNSFPVTVISVLPNTITQVKTREVDGYSSIQVTTGSKSQKHLKKPESGHFRKASVDPGEGLWEFAIQEDEIGELVYWFNQFMDKLQGVVKDVVEASLPLSNLAQNLRGLTEETQRTIDVQQRSAQDAKHAVDTMSGSVEGVAHSAA